MQMHLSLAVAIGVLVSLPAAAQERKHLTQIGIPVATVAPGGTGFVQLSGTNRSPAGRVDGSMALGFGFGSAERNLGVQVTAQITSLTDAFADSGYLQLKLSRRMGGAPLYLAVQGEHLASWGDSRLIPASARVMATWFGQIPAGGDNYPVMLTLGAGNRVREFSREPGVFAGFGLGLTPTTAVSAAYSGDYFDLGLGFRINDRLSLNAAVNDVFDQEDRRRLSISVTYAIPKLFGG